MRSFRIASILLCFVLWSGCNNDNGPPDAVTSFSNPNVNFTRYKTFAFASESTTVKGSIPTAIGSNLQSVNDAMKTQLEQEGLTQVSLDGNPDVIAFNLAATNDKAAVSWDCVPGYWYGYWIWDWTPCVWLTPVYSQYVQGTAFLGLPDPLRRQVVFGGTIRGVANGSGDVQNRIDQDVAAIFDHYPAHQTGRAGDAGLGDAGLQTRDGGLLTNRDAGR